MADIIRGKKYLIEKDVLDTMIWGLWQKATWSSVRGAIIKKASKNKWVYYFSHNEIKDLNYGYIAIYTTIYNTLPEDGILSIIEQFDPGFMYPIKCHNFNPKGFPKGTVRIDLR